MSIYIYIYEYTYIYMYIYIYIYIYINMYAYLQQDDPTQQALLQVDRKLQVQAYLYI
jgi:hypothetical protein